MSNMLGRSRPYDNRAMHCCPKHGGPEPKGPKRQHEKREWQHEAELELTAEEKRCAAQ